MIAIRKRGKADGHRLLVNVLAACMLPALAACATREATQRAQSFDSAGAADTAVIRGPGVPTAPDDTLGTRYGKHYGPARILPPPDCLPTGFALCIADTARTVQTYSDEAGGGVPDERATAWLVFASEQDSMQVFVVALRDAYLWMSPASAAGFEAEHAINDASWIRARFAHSGTYVYSARITSEAVAPYELRVAPVIATGASRPIGKSGTLTIQADSSARVAVVPLAMARAFDRIPLGADLP
jgi:hypothetical protein